MSGFPLLCFTGELKGMHEMVEYLPAEWLSSASGENS